MYFLQHIQTIFELTLIQKAWQGEGPWSNVDVQTEWAMDWSDISDEERIRRLQQGVQWLLDNTARWQRDIGDRTSVLAEAESWTDEITTHPVAVWEAPKVDLETNPDALRADAEDPYFAINRELESTISDRDAVIVWEGGETFGDAREAALVSWYEAFSQWANEDQLDLISRTWEDGEREIIPFNELTEVQLGMLSQSGYDMRELAFLWADGQPFNSEAFADGGEVILNIGDNQALANGDWQLEAFRDLWDVISVDGQRARYREAGPYGDGGTHTEAGYYTEHGPVQMRDGMAIRQVEAWETDSGREEARQTRVDDIVTSRAGRELYDQALANPNDPIDLSGQWKSFVERMLLAVARALEWTNQTPEVWPDGTLGTRWPDGSWSPLTGSEFAENYTGNMRSYPAERSASWTTLCSKTARLNLQRCWVSDPHRWSSARASFNMYGGQADTAFPTSNRDARVADVFIDASPANAQYGHRVCAFKQWENWMIMDPYYNIPGHGRGVNPIPAETYLNHMCGTKWRRFWWAHYPNASTPPAMS